MCNFGVCFQEERWFSEELKKELDKVQGQLATNKVNPLKCLVVQKQRSKINKEKFTFFMMSVDY